MAVAWKFRDPEDSRDMENVLHPSDGPLFHKAAWSSECFFSQQTLRPSLMSSLRNSLIKSLLTDEENRGPEDKMATSAHGREAHGLHDECTSSGCWAASCLDRPRWSSKLALEAQINIYFIHSSNVYLLSNY